MALNMVYRPFYIVHDERSVGAHEVCLWQESCWFCRWIPSNCKFLQQINIADETLHGLVDTVVSFIHGKEEPHERTGNDHAQHHAPPKPARKTDHDRDEL